MIYKTSYPARKTNKQNGFRFICCRKESNMINRDRQTLKKNRQKISEKNITLDETKQYGWVSQPC